MGNHNGKEAVGIRPAESYPYRDKSCPKRAKKNTLEESKNQGDFTEEDLISRNRKNSRACDSNDADADDGWYSNAVIDYEVMLPIEMWSHIFSFLEVSDIYNASLTSSRFNVAASDLMLWQKLCEKHLNVSNKLENVSWKDYYKMLTCISWDPENCVPNEFKFENNFKTISKTTSYGVATARSRCPFTPAGGKYCFEVKVNYRRPNFFYGIGFIDKAINFNFCKSSYPKAPESGSDDKRYDSQWFYWSDGNCWDILGSHPVSAKTRKFIARNETASGDSKPSLAFHSGDVVGIVLDYNSLEITFFLNGQKAHQFVLPKQMELYLAVYFYNANDSVTIQHCDPRKYDTLVK